MLCHLLCLNSYSNFYVLNLINSLMPAEFVSYHNMEPIPILSISLIKIQIHRLMLLILSYLIDSM